jgi:hypothetical protein
MNTLNAQPGLWSIRCYRWLLWLYPSSFVDELGDSVEQAFRDMLRDAFQKRGYLGIALLWFRIVPDFLFSSFELLTSTAGDYLKWYFRLRWILACALGFGAGSMVALALDTGFFEQWGLSPRWGLAGLPLWLGLGFFQSHVLTNRFCHRFRWVCLTVLGGVIGTLASNWLSAALSLAALGPFFLNRWQTWVLLPALALLAALVGIAIGLLQWSAFRQRDVRRIHWVIVCAIGAYFSGLLSLPVSVVIEGFAMNIGADDVMLQLLRNAVAGALLGLATAGPLKRVLWRASGEQNTPSEGPVSA